MFEQNARLSGVLTLSPLSNSWLGTIFFHAGVVIYKTRRLESKQKNLISNVRYEKTTATPKTNKQTTTTTTTHSLTDTHTHTML